MRPAALTAPPAALSSATSCSRLSTGSVRSRQLQQRRRPQLDIQCQAGRSNGVATTTVVMPPPSKSSSSSSNPASRLTAPERLRDPAEIGARGTATAAVRDQLGDTSLHTYMTLPVEQYYILDPTKVQFISGNKFILSVPRIQLLGASLQPVIEVAVRSEPDAVLLDATDCKLNATGIMGGLDSKFAMKFATKLTWDTQQPPPPQQQQAAPGDQQPAQQQTPQLPLLQQQQPGATQGPAGAQAPVSSSNGQRSASAQLASGWAALRSGSWRATPAANGNSGSSHAAAAAGSITGSALVQVWCEVVPPFQLVPREVLEGSLNSVLTGLINSLLPWFMGQLAADYHKWAADENYRAARRLRSRQQYKAN